MQINDSNRADFIDAFLECAEWSSTWSEDDASEPEELDSLGLYWSPAAVEAARKLCNDFIDANPILLADRRIDAAQAGHDLWLTAHGHGAGFWDRGHGVLGELLTKAAKHAGCFDHVFPLNGELHFSP